MSPCLFGSLFSSPSIVFIPDKAVEADGNLSTMQSGQPLLFRTRKNLVRFLGLCNRPSSNHKLTKQLGVINVRGTISQFAPYLTQPDGDGKGH